MAEADLGMLIRLASTLDALTAAMEVVASPVPPEEGVPLMSRTQRVAVLAREALGPERAEVLAALLGPGFFDTEVPSFLTRASLAVLTGYLHGCVKELDWQRQLEANARAYAEQKLRDERGVDFLPS